MYDIYVILHFVLMLVWVAFAITLDFRFLRGFNMCSNEERVSLMRNVRALSDRTEMPASTFLPLLGILMLIENSFWLRVPVMHGKYFVGSHCYRTLSCRKRNIQKNDDSSRGR